MSGAARKKAKDLMAIALDDRNKEDKERVAAALNALKIIDRYGLLDSPIDSLLDGSSEEIRAAKTVVDTLTGRDFVDSVKRVGQIITGGRVTTRRRRG